MKAAVLKRQHSVFALSRRRENRYQLSKLRKFKTIISLFMRLLFVKNFFVCLVVLVP